MTSDLWPVSPSQRLEIAPPRGEALRRAIIQPAADVGVQLEPTLLERLLADAADEPGMLPLVQETMVLLWDAIEGQKINLSAYEQLGGEGRSGLAVAITTKADAVFAELSTEQQVIAQRIFLRLKREDGTLTITVQDDGNGIINGNLGLTNARREMTCNIVANAQEGEWAIQQARAAEYLYTRCCTANRN